MERTARLLRPPAGARKGLPKVLVFTDPERTPDLVAAAARMPAGAALVFRAFGAADAEAQGRRAAPHVRARGGLLLVGADAGLAARIGAQGVHLPERCALRARALKRRRPDWIVTVAAHSLRAARRAKAAGADAAVVSAVFPSSSRSAGAPIGPLRLALTARAAGLPVYALGGVNARTARRLKDLPLAGLAAVDAFRICPIRTEIRT